MSIHDNVHADTDTEALATLGFTAPEPVYLSEAEQTAYDALMPTPSDTTENEN
ncbi:hypothetical protein [[Micrococcus luteus] ATCC 49442]|uniref:hypothetical protein n=1 Tax=[Micrococcus luteus] ATCC 49442 TaxID=2698727 RepID=UPI0013DC8BE9|nr:hypothetical protein [[Micrococcus luteus] ATCC 49442]